MCWIITRLESGKVNFFNLKTGLHSKQNDQNTANEGYVQLTVSSFFALT